MYNFTTEEKIKNIPSIGEIDVSRLPQELTRIYAQIVSLRQNFIEGKINFKDQELQNNLKLLRELSSNLETILLVQPNHAKKESIAFVAATAHSLIFKIENLVTGSEDPFQINSISPYISSVVLFLIANSQADAAEAANFLIGPTKLSPAQQNLIDHIITLASGKIKQKPKLINEKEIINSKDLQETALNLLWFELTKGVNSILEKLSGKDVKEENKYFEKVINLSVENNELFHQNSVFAGPNRLARLLSICEVDILRRSIVSVKAPQGVDPTPWNQFLEVIATERPYLWENHISAIEKGFLQIGVSTVLTLPTGAGKSTLSELKVASSIFSKKQVVYIVPTHALEDQVSKNFRKIFFSFQFTDFESDGEYTEADNLDDYPILVMTPEKCLTLLNTNEDFFRSLGLVVFDEFHLIHGSDIKKDRRAIDAMFCLLSLFTIVPKADFLLISAMVENGEEIVEWVKQVTSRDCLLFNSSWKPTRQLHGCLVFEDEKIKELNQNIRIARQKSKTKGPPSDLKNKLNAPPKCIFSMKNIWETTDNIDYFVTSLLDREVRLGINNYWSLTSNRNDVAANLAIYFANLRLKTLVFVDNPIVANSTAKTISEGINDKSNKYDEYLALNKNQIKSLQLELGSLEASYFSTFKNVAVHHGQLLPIERNLIEQYFKIQNGANALIATATLAQGINLPAEIVIIAGDDRFDEEEKGRERVRPHELLNAAGRAGRAGLSSQGAVILIPGDIVTIDNMTISNRWWQLKNEVFSKGDQCLKIDDPLGHYLDALQSNGGKLEDTQISILYRFKSEKLPIKDSDKLLNNSFYAFKAKREGKQDLLASQIKLLIDARKQLDNETDNNNWIDEISYKLNIDPGIVSELSKSIDTIDFVEFCSMSIENTVRWFFQWIKSNQGYLQRIFTRASSINHIKRSIGLKYDVDYPINEILDRTDTLVEILINYIKGIPLDKINELIPNTGNPDGTPYLRKARNFALRTVPELSFGFGIITMVVIEKAKHKGIDKSNIPMDIRVLASCIREGFDSSEKLYFKRKKKLLMRVETHDLFEKLSDKESK